MTSAAKVGAFMLIILAVLGYFIFKIEDIRLDGDDEVQTIEALFESVAGLDVKAPVRVAGVRKGRVTKIRLDPDGRARVTLELDGDVPIHQGAKASIANLGLLGEKYVEFDSGDPKTPKVAAGDRTIVVLGTQPASIDEVTTQVSEIATDVKAITESLRSTLGGPQGQARLDDIVGNVHDITARVRMIIEANQTNLNVTASNFRKITDDLRVEIPRIAASLERFANSMSGTVGENREDVRQLVQNLKGLSADLKTTATNLNDITGQVRSGEGTVGKLIYNDEAHKKLTSALSSVESGVSELKNTIGRVGKIQLELGIRGDYLAGLDPAPNEGFDGNSRSGLLVHLIPNPERNRFYSVELMDDPRGHKKEKIVTTTTTDEAGNSSTITRKETKFDRQFLVTAQAGWQMEKLALRVGLIDSQGGVGADYKLNERIAVSGEAFDFGSRRDDNPHLRLYGRYTLRREKPESPMLFISTGIDNPFNDTAFILGGGVRWKDEDLKYLLGSLPIK